MPPLTHFSSLTAMTRSPTMILPSRWASPPSVMRDMKMPSQPSLNGGEPLPPAMLKPNPWPIWSRMSVVCNWMKLSGAVSCRQQQTRQINQHQLQPRRNRAIESHSPCRSPAAFHSTPARPWVWAWAWQTHCSSSHVKEPSVGWDLDVSAALELFVWAAECDVPAGATPRRGNASPPRSARCCHPHWTRDGQWAGWPHVAPQAPKLPRMPWAPARPDNDPHPQRQCRSLWSPCRPLWGRRDRRVRLRWRVIWKCHRHRPWKASNPCRRLCSVQDPPRCVQCVFHIAPVAVPSRHQCYLLENMNKKHAEISNCSTAYRVLTMHRALPNCCCLCRA